MHLQRPDKQMAENLAELDAFVELLAVAEVLDEEARYREKASDLMDD